MRIQVSFRVKNSVFLPGYVKCNLIFLCYFCLFTYAFFFLSSLRIILDTPRITQAIFRNLFFNIYFESSDSLKLKSMRKAKLIILFCWRQRKLKKHRNINCDIFMLHKTRQIKFWEIFLIIWFFLICQVIVKLFKREKQQYDVLLKTIRSNVQKQF